MSIAMLMAMASCSSSDDAVAENNVEGKLVQMTFTATQESNVDTRSALGTGNSVVWKSGDKISVFDGSGIENNHKFTLDGDGGSTSGSFTGTAASNPNTLGNNYYAVYPYTEGACLEENSHYSIIKDITLPSTQTAIKDSFDPKAALMIAKSSDKNNLNFQNVVSLVKVTTEFDCRRIELKVNEYSDGPIAGKGTVDWSDTNPSISIMSDDSKSIVLKPEEGKDKIEAGTYYIAVKPGNYTAGWSISFTSTDYNVYTCVASSAVDFNRSKIRSIGSFSTSGTWTSTSRGNKVTADKEVDLGLTIEQDGKKYRVIFAKSNLTSSGLAASETAYGDYFAWGATSVWYSAINKENSPWTITPIDHKSDGYVIANAPFYNSSTSSYDKYTADETLDPEDDAARQILRGDWQLPTQAIWNALYNTTNYSWEWKTVDSSDGYKVTSSSETNKSIFLPAAGFVGGYSFYQVGSNGGYWSGTAYSSTNVYHLNFYNGTVYLQYEYGYRYYGFSVRPVRLVAE